MNNLQELNLISVLKNLDNDVLERIFSKSNPVRLYNILWYAGCDICSYTINSHEKCACCNKLK